MTFSVLLSIFLFFQSKRRLWLLYPSPLSLFNTLHPSCFLSCECGRHWSVEAYNDARRNPRAWALDENLFGVCECHPTRFCCAAPPACVCIAPVWLWQELDSQLLYITTLYCIATTSNLLLFVSESVCFLNCFYNILPCANLSIWH